MLGTALAVLRVQPAARAALALRDQRVTLQQQLDSTPPIIDLTTLTDEVDALRAEREALLAQNAERALRIAPEAEVPDLEHRVAALAREAGLRLVAQDAGAGPRARRWRLAGSFAGLWTFIGRLETLPRRVVLRDLQVDVRPREAAAPLVPQAPEPPLLIQLTVLP
jgi:hypothetical protein